MILQLPPMVAAYFAPDIVNRVRNKRALLDTIHMFASYAARP